MWAILVFHDFTVSLVGHNESLVVGTGTVRKRLGGSPVKMKNNKNRLEERETGWHVAWAVHTRSWLPFQEDLVVPPGPPLSPQSLSCQQEAGYLGGVVSDISGGAQISLGWFCGKTQTTPSGRKGGD